MLSTRRILLVVALAPLVLVPRAIGQTRHGGAGGTFRGPGDTVPPEADAPPAPCLTGRPAAPRRPEAPRPTPPGVAPTGATPPPVRSIPEALRLAELDRTEWWDWWDYTGEIFLDIDGALARLHPTTPRAGGASDDLGRRRGVGRRLVYGEVVPALARALDEERDPAFRRRVLLALGQIGEVPPRDGLASTRQFDLIAPHLADDHMGVAEAAVVGLGALGSPAAVRLLAQLVLDSAVARRAVERHEVPVRMRALAAYGLGVSGGVEVAPEVRRTAVHALVRVLSTDVVRYPDVQAAAVIGLGLCPAPDAERIAQVEFLLRLLDDEDQPRMVRTHVPTAIARLIATGDIPVARRDACVVRFMDALDRAEDVAVRRSAILALGLLGDGDDDPLDREVRDVLGELLGQGDLPSRSFAAIALGQIAARYGAGEGGPRAAVAPVTSLLTRRLVDGKSFERPWAALALGVLGYHLREAGESLPQAAADALRAELRLERNPLEATSFALALGMIGDQGGFETVSERLLEEGNDEYASFLAVGLGLFRHPRGNDALVTAMGDAMHRPTRMESAALGRALIGDRALLDELVERLDDCDCGVSTLGVCRALGWTADDRAIAPLLELLEDPETNTWTRMNAVEALGRIADRSNVPWDVRISAGLNYLDAPTSLTDPSGFGILDTF